MDTAIFVPGRGLYVFSGDQIWRYSGSRREPDPGYPKPITAEFPGVFQRDLNAALLHPDGSMYLFRGDQHIRYNLAANRPYLGYPRPYEPDWPGVFPGRIDAAITWAPDIVYLFSGHRYTSFSLRRSHARPGFPKLIADNWPGLRSSPVLAGLVLPDHRRVLVTGGQTQAYDRDGQVLEGELPGLPISVPAARSTAQEAPPRRASTADTRYEPGEREWSRTSPGQIDTNIKDPETGDPGFLLWNFAENSSELKKEHLTYLGKFFDQSQLQDPHTLFPLKRIGGFTDSVRRGGGNQPLRDERAKSVLAGLQNYAIWKNVDFPRTNQGQFVRGEDLRWSPGPTNNTRTERAYNRSVFVGTYAYLPPAPAPPTPKPPTQQHTSWALGFIGNLAWPAETGESATIALLRVREVPSGEKFFVAVLGFGPGVSADLGILLKDVKFMGKILNYIIRSILGGSISIDSIVGKEQAFATPREAHKDDFRGVGLITHYGAASWGETTIGFPLHTIPEAIPAPASFSLGANVGAEGCIFIPFSLPF